MLKNLITFISKQRLVIGLTVFVLSVIAMTSALLYTGVNRGASTSKAECFDWGCNITESLGDDSPWSFWGWGRGDGDIYMVDDNTRSGGEGGGGGGQVEEKPRGYGPDGDWSWEFFQEICRSANANLQLLVNGTSHEAQQAQEYLRRIREDREGIIADLIDEGLLTSISSPAEIEQVIALVKRAQEFILDEEKRNLEQNKQRVMDDLRRAGCVISISL